MSGIKLAAIYGFPPFRLGLCGVQNKLAKEMISSYLAGEKVSEEKIKEILKTFKSAFSYYKLIARYNGIKNPFNKKAVEAYWIGNDLLEKVPAVSLKEMIVKDFGKNKKIPFSSLPHHSFHVLILGAVSSRIILKGNLLDICRISWGKIVKKPAGQFKKGKLKIIIEYRPLEIKNKKYLLGKEIRKSVYWDKNLTPKIDTGDTVAVHWSYVVQVLDKTALANLKKYTKSTLDSLNKLKSFSKAK